MVRAFFSLLVGWSLSSWVLTETFFFFPSVEPFVVAVEEMITIPRHDQWDLDRVQQEANRLSDQVSEVGGVDSFVRLFDRPSETGGQRVAFQLVKPVVFELGEGSFDRFQDSIHLGRWGS